jgi:hypothetical protein
MHQSGAQLSAILKGFRLNFMSIARMAHAVAA